jgi:hypothetical protein
VELFDGETLYLKVPQGTESWYGNKVYLLLRKTLYGLKQSAFRFGYIYYLLTIVHRPQFERSKGGPLPFLQVDTVWRSPSMVFVG